MCSLSDQELFPGQYGGLDSGFNSVDSGSKRWSGNEVRGRSTKPFKQTSAACESIFRLALRAHKDVLLVSFQSADDFSERSLRLTEMSRELHREEDERNTLLDTPKGTQSLAR